MTVAATRFTGGGDYLADDIGWKRENKTMKKYFVLLCCALFIAALAACGSKPAETSYQQISQEEAKNLMDTEASYIILDVRTEEEYRERHIPGAVCVPNETISDTLPQELPDTEQMILVYCRSGNRSKQAAEKLAAMGYTDIREFGGITTWPYETVSDE